MSGLLTPQHRPAAPAAKPFKSKGMQLGKKSKNADLLGAMGSDAEMPAAAAPSQPRAAAAPAAAAPAPIQSSAATVDPLELLPPVAQQR